MVNTKNYQMLQVDPRVLIARRNAKIRKHIFDSILKSNKQ